MAGPVSRKAVFSLVIAVLVLDLWSKQWAVTHLASFAHPMAVTKADGASIAAAFAARGLDAKELDEARTTGVLWRYRKASGLKADAVLGTGDGDLDLLVIEGSGLPAPRRLRLQAHDLGKTLGAVAAAQWRVEPDEVQGLLDRHVLRAEGRVADLNAAAPDDGAVVLRERSITVVDRFASLVYAENTGAAWSFLATAPPMVRHVLFVTTSLIASILMGWALWHGRMGTTASTLALAGILGGAIGNLVDRVRYHAVVDFVYNYVFVGGQVHGWPVYNVADIGITLGVVAIAVEMLVRRQPAPVEGKA